MFIRFNLKRLIIISMTVMMMGVFIGCTQNTDSNRKENIVYSNENLGFSMELPDVWDDKYIIKESDNSISFFSKKVYEKDGMGLLFTIERVIGDLITEDDIKQAPVSEQIVLQGNGYTYLLRMPSDMQYPIDDEELSNKYTTMSDQISEIMHFNIIGDKKPKALNDGFKVVGSGFFIVEIPNDWRVTAHDGNAPRWDIYDALDKNIGQIDLIPYKSEGFGKESITNNNILQEYLFDNETSREFRIIFRSKDIDQDTIEKINNSFKFVNGPFNIVDLQSGAEQYLAEGGKKIFGQIKDFEIENGKPVSVSINVMKFLTDDSNDEYPNGFRIVDLYQTETYSLDFGVRVAPLAAPNFNTYGIYEIPQLDDNFIKNYGNFNNFYYDFIIGKDGELKIILGHYIP